MKATELIDELQKQIKKRGDCDVYYEYDGGIRIECQTITYRKHVDCNEHTEHWGKLKKVFIINLGW